MGVGQLGQWWSSGFFSIKCQLLAIYRPKLHLDGKKPRNWLSDDRVKKFVYVD